MLSDEDKLRRSAINSLMCHFMLDIEDFCVSHNKACDALDDSLPALGALHDDGLIYLEDRLILVTPKGRRFIRNIATCFDQYLEQGEQKHSLAV